MQELTSFRQVGRDTSGKLVKGPVIDAFNRMTQPSIPTSNEQVLSVVEKKGGFGTTSDRFMASPGTRSPGPGEYMAYRSQDNPSLSKKGFGTLIAREDRFRRFQYYTPVPGPGKYEARNSLPSQSPVRLMKPQTQSFVIKEQTPSPAQYNPRSFSSTRFLTSVFRSTSKKCMLSNQKDSPAPWQYNVDSRSPLKQSVSAAFKPPVKARRTPINLYDPHADIPKESSPGPGAYEIAPTSESPSKPSFMFLESNIDRFGLNPKLQKTKGPGPGTYFAQSTTSEKVPASGAVFLSESERIWMQPERKPPGPAFYKPLDVAKKRSFHLNSNGLWV